jgi:hypothetical protein
MQCLCFPAHFIYQRSIHMSKIFRYQRFVYLFITYKMRIRLHFFLSKFLCIPYFLNMQLFSAKSETLSLISQSAGYHLPQNTAFSIFNQVYNTA